MADFIAVIRRAVDGLSDDTPEMRAKVYEKARAAVQRQLDNMNPRPADEMIARQMAKLSEAIDLVESEHAGAAAVEPEEPPPAPPEAPLPSPVPEPETPTPAGEPEPEPHPETEAEAESEEEPETAVVAEQTVTAQPGPADEEAVEPESPEEPEAGEAEEAVSETAEVAEVPSFEAPAETPYAEAEPAWEASVEDNPFEEPAEIFAPQEPVSSEDSALPEPAGSWHEEQSHGDDGSDGQSGLKGIEPESGSAAATDLWPEIDEMPPRPDLEPTGQAGSPDEWENFEKIIGYDRTAWQPPAEPGKPHRSDDLEIADAISHLRGHSVEAEADHAGSGRARLIGGALAALVVLLGVGYAGWHYSDKILGLVNGSGGTAGNVASQTAPGTAGQEAAKPAGEKNAETSKAAPAVQEGPQKFTQRLMPDGSEVDTGTSGEPAVSGSAAQGTSVTGQSEEVAQAKSPSASTETANKTPQQEAANATAKPVKMFLYEERLGQASPTALDGTVTWSVQTDKESGSSQKAIEADIEVPGRKLSAVMTIKRNTDPSLPASHIIELTFSLPKDFEGGGIENVLRIAMKQNEQDQGDPLIAVPAKITDYFHMVALNAYPDAVKTNLELLKTRDWIDIPITYSNGRRALLTLQKGPEGEAVFNEVLADWANASQPSMPPVSDVPVPTPDPAQSKQ